MSRTLASARKAGSSFERSIADYLAVALEDDRIDRRVKTGSSDRGDIGGVRTINGGRVVIECKNYGGNFKVAEWLRQADVERGNDDAVVGAVVAKRKGVTAPGEQVVFMTVDDLVNLLSLNRPDLHHVFETSMLVES